MSIDITDNVIYSLDIIEWLYEVRDEILDLEDALNEHDADVEAINNEIIGINNDTQHWFDLEAELQDEREWRHGLQLVADDYFTQHAIEVAEECYDLPNHWPVCHIDWEAAAKHLKQDYSSVDVMYKGREYTFWYRS